MKGGVWGRWIKISFSFHKMQIPGPKSSPAEQPVGVGGVNLLSCRNPCLGLFPLFPLQLQLESLLLSWFQAFLLFRRYHILPQIWLHSCGKWNDSQFWDDLGIFWKRCCVKCWATRKPIFSWELSGQTALQYKLGIMLLCLL